MNQTVEKAKALKQSVIYFVLVLVMLLTLAPLALLVVNSFKSQSEIVANPLQFPSEFSFQYIQHAAEQIHLLQALGVTALITVLSILLLVLVSSLTAWLMVRTKSVTSIVLLFMFSASMLIPFQSVMYPLLSLFENMGLKNLVGLILMYVGFGLSMSVFLYHGFLKSVPLALEEAAVIDGAGIFQLFFRVVFPLVKTTTVTVIILNSVWIWNDYLLPFLVIGNQSYKTLTLELYFAKQVSGQYGSAWDLIFPAVFISIIPIIVLFIFLQKYIIKGVSDGAVKG
ncbi:carbohydrate ABC transporter permease [Paenibacillus phocaensis]|uniref:carbohydrate ABC transporter permease n=1 Tax=Paenibacillus phocaensis TaxID=1776378 RepID=UPI000839B652|nr:carbohydrate ABC transporter permease [Paenibacillus phocaensis]